MDGPLKTNPVSAVLPELRQKAIDEAHAALLSSPTQTDPGNSKATATAKRRQTAHGRLEASGEQDIYAFNASDDDGFHPSSDSKKRKRPSSENKAARMKPNNDDDGYEKGAGSSRKKPARRAKSAGDMSVLDLLGDTSEENWRPNASKPPTSGRKSTRGNTAGTDLLPPLPKPKRKPRESAKTAAHHDPQQFDGNLSLGFEPSNTRSAEIQVAATEPISHTAASTFVIDLTHDELVRRAEYDALSPALSAAESLQEFPTTNRGGVHGTPDLYSTIPDPPYNPNLPLSQIAAHLAACAHIPESRPLAPPSVASDSPLSSLENTPVKSVKKKPTQKKRAATDQNLGLNPPPEGDHGFGSFPIASEWRAAKGKARQGMVQATYAGRAKTSNAVDLFAAGNDGGSELDDIWNGDGKATVKKKKLGVRKRKSTATNDGDLGAETKAQKAKPKRRKSKAIEALVIGDTEDELSGGSKKRDLSPHGVIQVAATASAESLLNPHGIIQVAATASAESPLNPQVSVELNANQKSKTSEDDTIIVNNSPHDGTGNGNQPVADEYRPPAHGTGVKKVHRWGRPKFLDEPVGGDGVSLTSGVVSDAGAAGKVATDQPAAPNPPVSVENEPELLPEPIKPAKKETPAAKRRKSKKDEPEEEDWTGDPEPTRKPASKKETKAKAPRVTKKDAAAAAREAREQKEKPQLQYETIKDSGNESEDLAPTAIIVDPEPAEQIPVPEPTKKGTKKMPAKKAAKPKKAAKVIVTSKETVSDTDEEDEKKDISAPAPESKPETPKEEPQTPSKKLIEKVRKTPHSPINKGPVKFRVGLSRRAHIEPLLKIIRK